MNLFIHNFACLCVVVPTTLLVGTLQVEMPDPFKLERPGDRQFVLDKANLISDVDEQKIKQVADKLLKDKAAPIIVVTIESMAQHGGAGLSIETFARLLFDQWGIGPAKLGSTPWNYGMLLLVSKQDRKARIELGAGWKHEKDVAAQQIMDKLIVPQFSAGIFRAGSWRVSRGSTRWPATCSCRLGHDQRGTT